MKEYPAQLKQKKYSTEEICKLEKDRLDRVNNTENQSFIEEVKQMNKDNYFDFVLKYEQTDDLKISSLYALSMEELGKVNTLCNTPHIEEMSSKVIQARLMRMSNIMENIQENPNELGGVGNFFKGAIKSGFHADIEDDSNYKNTDLKYGKSESLFSVCQDSQGGDVHDISSDGVQVNNLYGNKFKYRCSADHFTFDFNSDGEFTVTEQNNLAMKRKVRRSRRIANR